MVNTEISVEVAHGHAVRRICRTVAVGAALGLASLGVLGGPPLWMSNYEKSVSLRESGQFDQALVIAEAGLLDAKGQLGVDSKQVLDYLVAIARIHQDQKRYDEAERYFLQAVEASNRLYGKESLSSKYELMDLAGNYELRGNREAAEKTWLELVHIAEKAGGPASHELFLPLRPLAKLYRSQGRADEAFAIARRLLALAEVTTWYDVTPHELQSLGALYVDKGDLKEAIRLHERAAKLLDRDLAKAMKDPPAGNGTLWRAAVCRERLAMLQAWLGNTRRSEKLRQEASKIRAGMEGEPVFVKESWGQSILELQRSGQSDRANPRHTGAAQPAVPADGHAPGQ
jgi:tetratricopeptide (TPR) repeat protein